MKRLEEAQETLQHAIHENWKAILAGDEAMMEETGKELERVKDWHSRLVDDLQSQARQMKRRADKFDVKWEDDPFGSNDVVPEFQLLVTHNGTQWGSLSMTVDEMEVIRDMLTEKLVQLGKEPDPKLEGRK